MNFKTEKNLKIVNEIMGYCYHFKTDDVTVNVHLNDNITYISVKALIENFPEKALENLVITLGAPRQREVEEYYWHLGGECEFDSELTLVGMMTDRSIIRYSGGVLEINLERLS